MKRRAIAWIVCFAVILSMLPLQTFADDDFFIVSGEEQSLEEEFSVEETEEEELEILDGDLFAVTEDPLNEAAGSEEMFLPDEEEETGWIESAAADDDFISPMKWLEGKTGFWFGNKYGVTYYWITLRVYDMDKLYGDEICNLYYYPEEDRLYDKRTNKTYKASNYITVDDHWGYWNQAIFSINAFDCDFMNYSLDTNKRYRFDVAVKTPGSIGAWGTLDTDLPMNGTDIAAGKKQLFCEYDLTCWYPYVGKKIYITYTLNPNLPEEYIAEGKIRIQWQRAKTETEEYYDIPGAIYNNYTAVKEDEGQYLRAVISIDGYVGTKTTRPIPVNNGVALEKENFPDAVFREALKVFDTNHNSLLSVQEIEKIKEISFAGKNIQSIEGIRYFPYLEELDLSNNKISSADLRKNENLRILDLSGNPLDELNIYSCQKLEELYLDGINGSLSVLTLSAAELNGTLTEGMNSLKVFSFTGSSIKKLYLSLCEPLRETVLYGSCTTKDGHHEYIKDGRMVRMDDFPGKGLSVLIASYNRDFYCEEFRRLVRYLCHDDGDGWLSLSEEQGISAIDFGTAYDYEVTSLKGIEYLPNLERLMSGEWFVSYADLSRNQKLEYVDLGGNPLSSFQAMQNPGLETLILTGCDLSYINLYQNYWLKEVELGSNELETITLPGVSRIEKLDVSNNNLKGTLDVSSQAATIKELRCQKNQISVLGISYCNGLEKLHCHGNEISTLNINNNDCLKQAYAKGKVTKGTDDGHSFVLYTLSESGKTYELKVDETTKIQTDLLPLPQITKSPKALTVNEGETAAFSVEALNTVSYQWFYQKKTGETSYGAVTEAEGDSARTADFSFVPDMTFDGCRIFCRAYNTAGQFDESTQVVLTVIPGTIEATGITLDQTSADVATKDILLLNALITPVSAGGQTVTWESSDPEIASVDSSGLVTANKYGKVTVTASLANGLKADCEIQTRFYDVNDPARSFYTPVYWAVDNKITKCTVNFRPDDGVTRGEFTAFLYRLAKTPTISSKDYTTKFTDVDKSTKFYKEISWAVKEGIIQGFKDNTFRPNDGLTRAQCAIMIWRYAGKPKPKGTCPFPDVTLAATSDTYKAVTWGAENEIIKGSGGKFKPTDPCTRANVVTFLYRYDQKFGK